jgi:hypothetical protein
MQRERPTIDMYYREDDAMDGSDGGKKQRSCQASVPEPFCFSSQYTGYYEDIVPGKNRGEVSVSPRPGYVLLGA